MKRPRLHGQPGGAQSLQQLDSRVAVERRAQDPLAGHAAAEQRADALDQHRRLAAARGRDHLHDAVAGGDRPPLLGVEHRRRRRHGRLRRERRAAAVQGHRGVERPFERVRESEFWVDELLGREPREPLFALDRQRRARSQRRLEDVPVQCAKIVEFAQAHAGDREPRGGRDPGEPYVRRVRDALPRSARRSSCRLELAPDDVEANQLVPR